jgi:hypothetical protein
MLCYNGPMPASTPLIPPPPPLRGADPASWAQDTVVRRMPAIARRVLSENDLLPAAVEAITALADELPRGVVRQLYDSTAPDKALWDAYIAPYVGQTLLDVSYLFAETYFYRRILEATGYFQPGPHGQADPYALQKQRGLAEMTPLSKRSYSLTDAIAGSLWGNQADLSLWPAGEGGGPGAAHLLVDDTLAVVAHLTHLAERGGSVALILDNAGAELVHDLLLADTLLAHGLSVVLHAKAHPIFVSDAIPADVHATIAWLAAGRSGDAACGERLLRAHDQGHLTVQSDWFWTSPLAVWELPAPLSRELAQSGLIISKGDANYRRWLGDRHWPMNTPLSQVVAYAPAPLLLLRTCKSEIAVGLEPTVVAAAAAQDAQWRTSGRWGMIQFSPGA